MGGVISCMRNLQLRVWHMTFAQYMFLFLLISKKCTSRDIPGFDPRSELPLASSSSQDGMVRTSVEQCDKAPGELQPTGNNSVPIDVFYLAKQNDGITHFGKTFRHQKETETILSQQKVNWEIRLTRTQLL